MQNSDTKIVVTFLVIWLIVGLVAMCWDRKHRISGLLIASGCAAGLIVLAVVTICTRS